MADRATCRSSTPPGSAMPTVSRVLRHDGAPAHTPGQSHAERGEPWRRHGFRNFLTGRLKGTTLDKAAMMIKARKLFKDVSDLPTIPVIASRVMRLLDDHESNPDEIADLILSDQVLAARVIRVVNSPLYMPGSKIT